MTFEKEVDHLRRRLEAWFNDKYGGREDTPELRAAVEADLVTIREIFPELDIAAEIHDDPTDEAIPSTSSSEHDSSWSDLR
jgi:hypothetical protein